jgi:hypothetical protein
MTTFLLVMLTLLRATLIATSAQAQFSEVRSSTLPATKYHASWADDAQYLQKKA